MGYILQRKMSKTKCYAYKTLTGAVKVTTDFNKATIFPTGNAAQRAKDHAPKRMEKYKIKKYDGNVISGDLQENDFIDRSPFPNNTRMYVYQKANGHCAICGEPIPFNAFTIDHIIPLSKGGTNDKENLQCCCKICNQMKHNLDQNDFFEKITQILKYQSSI